MHSSPSTTRAPAHSLLRDVRYTMIPHQIRGVTAGLSALDLEASPERLSALNEHHSADTVRYDNLVAYTRPVTCVAAIHCRTLLQFLGLQSNGSPTPHIVSRDREDIHEVWIGTFKDADGAPLEPVPSAFIERFSNTQEIALAWATTYDFAAQRLTDAMTDSRLTSAAIVPMLRKTFETVPAVVEEWFYERAALRANA